MDTQNRSSRKNFCGKWRLLRASIIMLLAIALSGLISGCAGPTRMGNKPIVTSGGNRVLSLPSYRNQVQRYLNDATGEGAG